MGNTDSIPLVSQAKSLTQYIGGDSAGALQTQENFAYRNTFPVISQVESAVYAAQGDNDKALDLQKKFADDMERVINSIPVAGHIKGGVHYALGQTEEGNEAMKSASHSTGAVIGGVGGFVVGGPVGAVAGGIAGGAATDGIITGSDILVNGKNAKPYGVVAAGEKVVDAIEGKRNITTVEGFDMAMMPISDGLGGFAGGKMVGKPLAFGEAVGADSEKVPLINKSNYEEIEKSGMVSAKKSAIDQKVLDNRANQLNPNHKPSGPGRPAGYKGEGSKADLDNHANQLNPNNYLYRGKPLAVADGSGGSIIIKTLDGSVFAYVV